MPDPKGIFADEGVQRLIAMTEHGKPIDETDRTEILGPELGSVVGAMQFLQELRTQGAEDIE